jgi:hypothetical protein
MLAECVESFKKDSSQSARKTLHSELISSFCKFNFWGESVQLSPSVKIEVNRLFEVNLLDRSFISIKGLIIQKIVWLSTAYLID